MTARRPSVRRGARVPFDDFHDEFKLGAKRRKKTHVSLFAHTKITINGSGLERTWGSTLAVSEDVARASAEVDDVGRRRSTTRAR